MEDNSSPGKHHGSGRRPFQYSLRSMLLLMTGAAVGLSLLVACPNWLVMLLALLLALAAPMVLTVLLIYGRGSVRTFSIGALFPAGVLLFTLMPGLPFPFFAGRGLRGGPDDIEERLFLAFFMAVAFAVIGGFGVLAVWVRWMVERRERRRGEGSGPEDQRPTDVEEPPIDVHTTPG